MCRKFPSQSTISDWRYNTKVLKFKTNTEGTSCNENSVPKWAAIFMPYFNIVKNLKTSKENK